MLPSYQTLIDQEATVAAKDTAKLSGKFQISIPKSIRQARAWHPGQRFAFILKGEGMLLVPVPPIQDLAGIASGATPSAYRDRTNRT
jgi:AbrB family looped-hinge helix DNA binding protein